MSFLGGPLDAILAEIGAAHRTWLDFVSSMAPDNATKRRGGSWSVVDALVHVASWKENALRVARLQSAPEAVEIGPDVGPSVALGIDVDGFNAEFMAAHADWTLDQSVEYGQRVHDELLEALTAVPSDRLFGGPWPHGASRWYWRPGVVHPAEHLAEFK
jgi:hypothetical protein